jgi:hypothetical protein
MSIKVFNNYNSENYMFRHWAIAAAAAAAAYVRENLTMAQCRNM